MTEGTYVELIMKFGVHTHTVFTVLTHTLKNKSNGNKGLHVAIDAWRFLPPTWKQGSTYIKKTDTSILSFIFPH